MEWSGRRTAVSLAGVAAVGAAIAGGYALGATSVTDEQAARAARADSARQAFVAARHAAYRANLPSGRHDGRSTGGREGAQAGARRGTVAASLAVQDVGRPLGKGSLPSVATGRSETEAEIGGIGGDGTAEPGSGGVLVVGDSLEVLTSPYLKQYLPGVHLTVNAVGGYSSPQIFGLFKESYDPSQSVIVFDAGTNDNPAYPQILAAELQTVAGIVGGRCMVVPTIHGLSVDGVDSSGKNRVVRAFAASRPGTQVPDWARFEAAHPELMQSDDLHPIPAGAQQRARLIAQGVEGCLAL